MINLPTDSCEEPEINGLKINASSFLFENNKLDQIMIMLAWHNTYENCLILEKMYGTFNKFTINEKTKDDIRENKIEQIKSELQQMDNIFQLHWKLKNGTVIEYHGPGPDMLFFLSENSWKSLQENKDNKNK